MSHNLLEALASLGAVVRVSTDADGGEANGGSDSPVFSPDGTRVAFVSWASNLVAGDTNEAADLFLKDLVTSAIVRVSTDAAGNEANGWSWPGVFSPDGTRMAFASDATNLVTGDTNATRDIFVKNLVNGTIVRVSTDAAGGQANGWSDSPVFSPDGTRVAFASAASNLVPGDTNASEDIFVKDLVSGAIVRVSTDAAGRQANSYSQNPAFSPDGTRIAFMSHASNLVPGDTNGAADVFVKDLVSGAIVRVSTDAAGAQANSASYAPVFSPDGMHLAFESFASNLVPGDVASTMDLFVKNLATGDIIRVLIDASGVPANSAAWSPVFLPDGMRLAVTSLVVHPVFGTSTSAVFITDLSGGEAVRVDANADGEPANGAASSPSFSPDGWRAAFASAATNLVPGDANEVYDVFVRTIAAPAPPPANQAPLARPDSAALDEGGVVLIDVLANDSDPDGDPLLLVDFAVLPTFGTVAIAGNQVRYTAAADSGGQQDFFRYIIADGQGGSAEGDVTISIAAIEEPPPPPPPPPPADLGFRFSNGSFGAGLKQAPPLAIEGFAVREAGGRMLVEATGHWNDVKNVAGPRQGWSEALGTDITIFNFVDARVDFSNAGDTALDVELVGVKRGEIRTDAGADRVQAILHSNGGTFREVLVIDTGAGDDEVLVLPVGSTWRDDQLLSGISPWYPSLPARPNGRQWNKDYDGRFSIVEVDLGAGDDIFRAQGLGTHLVKGGAGNDIAHGSGGTDVWILSGRPDGYVFEFDIGVVRITDIDPSDGDDGIDALHWFDQVQFGDGSVRNLTQNLTIDAARIGIGGFEIVSGNRQLSVAGFAAAGDVNGDGRGDVVIGVRPGVYSPVLEAYGRVQPAHVVFGGQQGGGVNLALTGQDWNPAGYGIKGGQVGDGMGRAVAGIGDLDGDGRADLLLGVPDADLPGRPGAGGAWVVFGKAGGGQVDLAKVAGGAGPQGVRIVGEAAFDSAGSWVAGGGDADGDGVADFLIAAPGNDSLGRSENGAIYVIYAAADMAGIDLGHVAAGIGGFKIAGAGSGHRIGSGVFVGDLNADGLDDILIGACGGDAYYLVFGRADGVMVDLAAIDAGTGDVGFRILMPEPGGLAPDRIGVAGDVNGDGIPDLLVGRPAGFPPGAVAFQAGAAFVVFGKADPGDVLLDDIAQGIGVQGFMIGGRNEIQLVSEANEFPGYAGPSILGVGDLNGDGYADLMVGDPTNSDRYWFGGAVYVVWGKPDGELVDPTELATGTSPKGFTIYGDREFAILGASAALAGDINGDGLQDYLFGHGWLDRVSAVVLYGSPDWVV